MKARYALPVLAVTSPFLFPWPVTLLLGSIASYVFPPTGFIAGLLIDTLYATSFPYLATAIGTAVSVAAYFVRFFVKRNIMNG